jgi:hypothetical protein
MILNIIDKRSHQYHWKQINAVAEPAHHGNHVQGADQTEVPEHNFSSYDLKENISVAEAVAWASALPHAVTLYFYDMGDGISVAGSISNARR